MLYLYAAVYDPEEGEQVIVIQPTAVLADDAGKAMQRAVRALPGEWEPKIDDIDFLIRPF